MQQCKHWAGWPTCLPHQPVHDSGELKGLTYSAYTFEESSTRIFALHRFKETNRKLLSSVTFQLTPRKISWKFVSSAWTQTLGGRFKRFTADKEAYKGWSPDKVMCDMRRVLSLGGSLFEIFLISVCTHGLTWAQLTAASLLNHSVLILAEDFGSVTYGKLWMSLGSEWVIRLYDDFHKHCFLSFWNGKSVTSLKWKRICC